MGRTQGTKESQIKYKMRNRALINKISRDSMKRNYTEEKKADKKLYYYKIRNYRGLNNIERDIRRLFEEV